MAAATAYRVVVRIEVRPGSGPEFEREWTAVGDSVARFDGNRGQWLARSAEDPDVYYVTSDWADEAAFARLERSDRHRRHRAVVDRFRVTGTMTAERVLRHVPPSGAE